MEVVAERFELETRVGSGGMGDVFRAKDRVTGARVALKMLHASRISDQARFRREGQLLAELLHPRVVHYVAHGLSPEGRPWLAMEWLDGEDLDARLTKSGLSSEETLAVGRQVAEALAFLHERGVVHRDVKPSNVFLVGGRVDQVKLLDLGVARLIHDARPATRSGIMIGTPGYMAPEQARGSKDIGAPADVFALGCLLHECLTGRPAFTGDNLAALLAKVLLSDPPRLDLERDDLPPGLVDLVARMLEKHPAARPRDGRSVLDELVRILGASRPSRPAPGRARAITGDERQLVSVLLAETGRDGLEPSREIHSEDATLAAESDWRVLVAGYGATLDTLANGAVVVALGGRGTAVDQAAHAARCALDLRRVLPSAVLALATGLGEKSGDGLVGDVIERASAALAAARAGERDGDTAHGAQPVFLDETTAGLLDLRFDVGGDERGLYIRGLRERHVARRTLLGKPSPCVGRERELGTLLGLFEEAFEEPVARAVLLSGPPGAGKSRLVHELLGRLRDAHAPEIWVARGDPTSSGSPFGLASRALRDGMGIADGESLAVRQAKVRARVARGVPTAEQARVTAFVGELLGVPFPDASDLPLRAARADAVLMGDQVRRALVDLLDAETSARPLVLVLEDLHWGDLPSVALVDAALRALEHRPFVVLGVSRPDVDQTFPGLWAQRNLQEIRLGPLTRRAAERLVREALGDDAPRDRVQAIVDRAEGNAFFLEELVRAEATGRGDALPGTVLAMTEARLAELEPGARRVLRAASVTGETFWRGSLEALLGETSNPLELDAWLAVLERSEAVHRRDGSRFPGEREFAFRHALVREAAYATLTDDDRALAHRLAGEWLERAGEPDALALAGHFERGGVGARAAELHARAALEAFEGHDAASALARGARAMELGLEPELATRLALMLAEAARWAGRFDDAARWATFVAERAGPESDAFWGSRALLVEAAMAAGKASAMVGVAEELLDALGRAALRSAAVVAAARVVPVVALDGSFALMDALLEVVEARGAAVLVADPAARAAYHAARVMVAHVRGRAEAAVHAAREARAGFEAVGDVRGACLQLQLEGFALTQVGQFELAEGLYREALARAERLGLAGVALLVRMRLAQTFGRACRFDESLALFDEAIRGFAALGNVMDQAVARAYRAGVLQIADRHEEAIAEASDALDVFRSSRPFRAALLGLVALAELDAGHVERGVRTAEEACAALDALGSVVEGELIIRLSRAEATYRSSGPDAARPAFAELLRELRERADAMHDPTWRETFLGRLGENQRILARAAELGV